jgi:hypothetical protein
MEKLTEIQNKNKSEALQSTLQTTTAISLQTNNFDSIVSSVGYSAKELIEKPPIYMLAKTGLAEKVETFLAVQLVKLMESVNINGVLNLQNYQIPTIAGQLVEMYPVESLEDFVLCFKRGGAGFYGTIYKLDASVLCEWMKAYLDEKYTFIEGKVKEEQTKLTEEQSVNYEEFKKRSGELFQKDKVNNYKENEYQKWRMQNLKYYPVENLQIYATSQEHAEQIVKGMIERGEIERVEDTKDDAL